jgi:sulfate permease, SulP family
MKPVSQARNDIFGGLVSAAVAIPLAMGYGMFALSALGEYYFADGALAGLATAFGVAIVCVLLGDRTTTVYAPRINSTFFLGILIYGLVHSDSRGIAAGGTPFILAIAFSVMMLGGVLEALFGLIKLGTLIKFAPQPVMAGFQNAAAALLFLVQIGNVCGFDHNVPFTQVPQHLDAIKPLSLAIAVITFVTMWNARKLLPKVPPIIVAIVLGCALYFFCRLIGLGAYLGPVITSASRPTMGFTAFDYFYGIERGGDFLEFVPTILGGALALALIASMDALLCAKLVTSPGEPRRDGDRLLLRLGIGNVAAACIGGITSGINIGASITNRMFGGRTSLSVLISAAIMLVAGTFLFRWLGQMPRVVLSAVIMVVAVQHFDLWSLRLAGELRKGPISNRYHVALDLVVVVVVAVLSIALNIVLAVFVGVAIAIALFVVRMSGSVIRRSYRCGTIHSRRSRLAPERIFLEQAGDAILVIELQGALFFGTGEKMLSEVEAELQHKTSCVILDLRRLTDIDSTGANALLELKTMLAQRDMEFLLALADRTAAMERLENFGVLSSFGETNILPDIDRAIERAENSLLRAQARLHRDEIALAEVGLFATLNPTDLAAVEPYLRRVSYQPGDVIFREGDPGDEVLVVTKGTASAFLESSPVNIRLATFAPGAVFGELAILDAGPRSATVIADEDLVCFVLTAANFAALTAKYPDVATRVLAAIGRELSGRLRTANRTIHQLET